MYLYNVSSGGYFYTSSGLFPSLYGFSLNTFLYDDPDTKNADHYTSNPRYFYNYATQNLIKK